MAKFRKKVKDFPQTSQNMKEIDKYFRALNRVLKNYRRAIAKLGNGVDWTALRQDYPPSGGPQPVKPPPPPPWPPS